MSYVVFKKNKRGLNVKECDAPLKWTFAAFIVDIKTRETTAMERRKIERKKKEGKKKNIEETEEGVPGSGSS